MDTIRGYGPSVLFGTKVWGCILEEAVDLETRQPMILFRTDGEYVRWMESAEVQRRSTAKACRGVSDMGMSEDEIVEMMRLIRRLGVMLKRISLSWISIQLFMTLFH